MLLHLGPLLSLMFLSHPHRLMHCGSLLFSAEVFSTWQLSYGLCRALRREAAVRPLQGHKHLPGLSQSRYSRPRRAGLSHGRLGPSHFSQAEAESDA